MSLNLPKLTPRLKLVASCVKTCKTAADIGTDHAYIPVYLVNSGVCENAVASDIVEGPLNMAKLTAKNFDATEKVKLVLADGLSGVKKGEAQEIIIAGMGGELIAKILDDCDWIKDKNIHLILQPMTAQEDLRKYLCENGFKIEKEAIASEKHGRKLYDVISVVYDGIIKSESELYFLVGELKNNKDTLSKEYLKRISESLLRHADGLEKAEEAQVEEIVALKKLVNDILYICKL